MVNASMPGLVKIGKTDRTVDQRRTELFTTGVPTRFEVAFKLSSDEYKRLESEIHSELGAYRVNPDREFFRFPVAGVIEVLKALHAGEPPSRIGVLKALHAGEPSTDESLFETLERELRDPHTRADAVSILLSYIDKYQHSFKAVIQLLIDVVDSENWSDKSYVKHQAIKWLRRTQDSRIKATLRRYKQRISPQHAEEKVGTRFGWLFFAGMFCILGVGVFLLVQLASC